jgi:SAM-dependent methyltransferase
MSGFSPEWLSLREGADLRARDATLGLALADRLQAKARVVVRDLGCGTGSNLRATYALLGGDQHWTLVDYDARLLATARTLLQAWADSAEADGETLDLMKSGKRLRVAFEQVDLVRDLDRALGPAPDLVTASALFDLCSGAFIDRFAAAVAERKAVFFTVLTYNGIQRWTPRHAADQACLDAFTAHQMTEKGFGVSAGPRAPEALATAFRTHRYTVREGDSPWLLSRSDQPLIDALAQGFADAVADTGRVDAPTLASWRTVSRTGAEVGHTDTLAFPPG